MKFCIKFDLQMNPKIDDSPNASCKYRHTNSIYLLNSPSPNVDRMYGFLKMKMNLASFSF